MRHLLQELRTLLQYEQALFGPYVHLGEEPTGESDSSRTAATVERSQKSLNTELSPNEKMDLFGNEISESGMDAGSPYERIHALIPDTSPLRRMTRLTDVEAYVRDTILIPLDQGRTNPVFGVGNPEADLMVIGEAPGADEDAQGEPFVGRAGQLLTKILEAIGFARSDVYIANILKSRPPNNRDPLPAEVEAHIPILYKQISLIRPKLLLSVGKTSGNALLSQQTTLGALRQRFHDFHGIPLMVTYHPAALLRNPQWKRPTWEDVQMLKERYDRLVGVEA